ncbi:MAG: carbon monoxide dehydrogenase subunit G [Ktedonobacteraceae bacterium]
MEISGSHKIRAPRQQVFNALLNPEVLKNSIPGCENAEYFDAPIGRVLKLTVSPSIPGLKGPYTVFLMNGEIIAPSRVTLIAEPSSSIGSIKATCVIDLTDDAVGTNLHYNANAVMEGKIAAIPDMIIKGGVKSALDQFFKNFEKQVSTIHA